MTDTDNVARVVPHLWVSLVTTRGWPQNAMALEALRTVAMRDGVTLTISRNGGTGVDRCRNIEIAKARACQPSPPDVFAFIDDDIIFNAEDAMKLCRFVLNGHAEVVGGAYPRKTLDLGQVRDAVKRGIEDPAELEKCATTFIANGYKKRGLTCESGSFLEVEELGTGFLFMSMKAVDRFIEHYRADIEYVTDYPPFGETHHMVFSCQRDPHCEREQALAELKRIAAEYHHHDGLFAAARRYAEAVSLAATTGRYITEDFAFCRKWRMMDPTRNKIYLALDCPLQHLGTYAYKGDIRVAWQAQVTETPAASPVVPGVTDL